MNKLIFSVLFILMGQMAFSQVTRGDCKIEVEVTKLPRNNGITEIRLRVNKAARPVHFVYYKESGDILSKDFTSASLRTTEKGKIYYAVKDAEGCISKAEINLETND